MENLRKYAEKFGIDNHEYLEGLHENAIKVAEAFARSGTDRAHTDSIPELYKRMVIAQIEVLGIEQK